MRPTRRGEMGRHVHLRSWGPFCAARGARPLPALSLPPPATHIPPRAQATSCPRSTSRTTTASRRPFTSASCACAAGKLARSASRRCGHARPATRRRVVVRGGECSRTRAATAARACPGNAAAVQAAGRACELQPELCRYTNGCGPAALVHMASRRAEMRCIVCTGVARLRVRRERWHVALD